MKKIATLLLYFIIATLMLFMLGLTSCSPTWHINRAIKKDPTILTTKHDTIIKTISDTGKVYFYGDTIVENNFVFISVKHEGTKTNLYWFLKSVKIEVPTENNVIIPPLSKREIKYIYRNKLAEIKQENRTERTYIRKDKKLKKHELKATNKKIRSNHSPIKEFLNFIKTFFYVIIAFVIGLFIGRFVKKPTLF